MQYGRSVSSRRGYLRDPNPRHRARALDVLGQLGAGKPLSDRPHFSECVSLAIESLPDDDEDVASSAAWALAHLRDDRAVTHLIGIRASPNPDARHAVAYGMHGEDRPDAITTLIELIDDTDDDVRDWATFGLGTADSETESGQFAPVDSSEIRQALRNRLDDPFEYVRQEALWGLALRRDPESLKRLLERLESDTYVRGDETTAEEILNVFRSGEVEDLIRGLRDLLSEISKDTPSQGGTRFKDPDSATPTF